MITFLKLNRDNEYVPVGYLEMLLASDICMSALNERKKIQLMALALEKMKYDQYVVETRHIMVAIMKSCNYAPFLLDVDAELIETLNGYTICYLDLVEKHAVNFLNSKKFSF